MGMFSMDLTVTNLCVDEGREFVPVYRKKT